jgi:hypothetical protein
MTSRNRQLEHSFLCILFSILMIPKVVVVNLYAPCLDSYICREKLQKLSFLKLFLTAFLQSSDDFFVR